MRSAPLIVILTLLVASAGVSAGLADRGTESGGVVLQRYVVGFERSLPEPALAEAGGRVLRADTTGAFAVVLAPSAARLAAVPGVTYVERDAVVRASGASFDGSTWDGSSWDGSTWDGSTWDGSTWDGSTWDGSTWDGSTWDGSTWDGSAWDGSTWDGSTWDGSTWDGGSWNGAAIDGSSSAFTGMDPGYPLQWGHGAVRLPIAWSASVGAGNRVLCVLDTGVDYNHPDLAPNLWRAPDGSVGYNVLTGSKDPRDDAGHGTHVAGIAAAAIGNARGVAGVTNAKIMAVKVLDATGYGHESDVATGLNWCSSRGAHVAVMSLGTNLDVRALADAVAKARSRGMVIVASAGNDGCACPQYPAAYPGVVGVGAINASLARVPFSNTGSAVDLVAPGFRVVSTFLGGTYAVGSGTSQAAPYVAGIAALAWGANPSLSSAQIESLLASTARDVGPAGVDPEYGAGIVDAAGAIQRAAGG